MPCIIKQITIIENHKVIGSKGTVMYFVPFNQYCYENVVRKECDCNSCDAKKTTWSKYWQIILNEEEFLLPITGGVYDPIVKTDIEKDLRLRKIKLTEQPADMWKVTKDLTGIDIKKNNKPDHNGSAIFNKMNKTQKLVGNEKSEIDP